MRGAATFVPFAMPLLVSQGASTGNPLQSGGALVEIKISAAIAVGKADTLIWAGPTAGESFIEVTIVNDGASPVYLNVNGGAAKMGEGIRINAEGGTYKANNQNTSAIKGIASAETKVTLTVS
jgi:hypothetical protein